MNTPTPHPNPTCYQTSVQASVSGRGHRARLNLWDFGSILQKGTVSQPAPLKACSSPTQLLFPMHVQPVRSVSWDTPVSCMASLGPNPWAPLSTPAPTVQLLLFLLLLVSAHPQGLSGMQGEPSLGESSSGEDDLGVEDLPSEEDAPGEADPPSGEDLPEVNSEARKEDSLQLGDLPTLEAPEDSQRSHGDEKGKWSLTSKSRLR